MDRFEGPMHDYRQTGRLKKDGKISQVIQYLHPPHRQILSKLSAGFGKHHETSTSPVKRP
jgi:hypothetical protein